MSNGPYMEPEPRFRYDEPVWFMREGVRVTGEVKLRMYSLGNGYAYQVRISPMAVYWAAEDELHRIEQPTSGEE